jgi:hypothetical protein
MLERATPFSPLKKRRVRSIAPCRCPCGARSPRSIREAQGRRDKGRGIRLWPGSRMTGWRVVHAVMAEAKLDGPHASPKGAAWLWGGSRYRRHSAKSCSEVARARATHHHRHLCQRRRRRGTEHRGTDVGRIDGYDIGIFHEHPQFAHATGPRARRDRPSSLAR